MAISTTLFAPQVPTIQPAFTDDDTAKIYFSLSQYNNERQFSTVSYKIIDPNKSAAWGTNIIKESKDITPKKTNSKYGQYYFTIENLNGLTKNQYYQIQITLHNGANESLPSQVSLLRPIPARTSFTINQSNVLLLDRISGNIGYADGSQVEQIHTYWVELKRSAETVYKSKVITNTFGTSFNSTIDDCFVTGSNLSLIVHYTTINGYSGEISKFITIGEWTTGLTISNSKVVAQPEKGSIRLEGILEGISGSGILKIQRSSEEYDYLDWRNVYEDNVDSLGSFVWEDTTVESQAKYKYRIAFETGGNVYAVNILNELFGQKKWTSTGGEVFPVSNYYLITNKTDSTYPYTLEFYQTNSKVKFNRVYFFSLEYKVNQALSTDTTRLALFGSSKYLPFENIAKNNSWTLEKRIFTAPSGGTSEGFLNFQFMFKTAVQTDTRVEIKNPQLFDLTEIYGSGKEPTTVEQFEKDFPMLVNYDSIYLQDKDTLLAIRYNPAITNFKYVSQENITNTIGGRYPVVRINGDTNYRQFTLTGTLSFQGNYALTEDSLDSRRRPMSTWFKEEEKSLYFKTTNAFANKLTDEKIKSYNGDFTYLEKKFRDIAIQFLTSKKPKIFRSNTEGCMLVSLSGISFTPNKQLGRNIYDFSATVTEFADYNAENLKKYGFNDSITQPSAYIMDASVYGDGYATVPYPQTASGLPVVVAIWE